MDLIDINPEGDNIHYLGVSSAAADSFRSGVHSYSRDHHGFTSLRIYSIESAATLADYFAQVKQVSPKINLLRPIWNIFNFDETGAMYQDAVDEYKELAAQGYQYLAMMSGGPSQRDHYDDFDDEKELQDLQSRQLLAWGMYMDMLDANPDVAAAVWGYEPVNEPDTYGKYDDLDQNVRVQTYLEHMCAIFDLVQSRHPRNNWHIAGWRYSTGHAEILQATLPDYNMTGAEYLRFRMGPDVEIRCSMHGQNEGFRHTPYNRLDYDTPNSWRRALRYRDVPIVNNEASGRNSFLLNMYEVEFDGTRTAAENDISYALGLRHWWWPLNNTSQSRIFDIGNSGDTIKRLYRGSFALKVIKQCYPQRPEYFSGPQNGVKDETSEDSWNIAYENFEPQGSEEFAGHPAHPANVRHSVVFGGAGHCRLNATDAQTNLLIGGDGRNYLYGGATSFDQLKLGRGGGVIRTGGGHNTVFSSIRQSRIYMEGWGKVTFANSASAFPDIAAGAGRQELILDPSGTYVVWFLDRSNDWAVSFKGAFQTEEDLRAAYQIVPQWYGPGAGTDLMINFPQGGSVRFPYTEGLVTQLHRRCLDIHEGWYADGWSEPLDYDPADLGLPPVIEDWDAKYTLEGNQPSAIFTKDGLPRQLRDAFGKRLTLDPTFIGAKRYA